MKTVQELISENKGFDFLNNEERYLDELVFEFCVPENKKHFYKKGFTNSNYKKIESLTDYESFKSSVERYLDKKFSVNFSTILKLNKNTKFISELIECLNLSYRFYSSFTRNDSQYKNITAKLLFEKINSLWYDLSDYKNEMFEGLKMDNGWELIFLNEHYYFKFNDYIRNNNIIEPFPDHSYLFRRMTHEKFMFSISHKDYRDWLLRNGFIKQREHHDFDLKNTFSTLKNSSTPSRENNFNNIFEL